MQTNNNPTRYIITPTFAGHFSYAINLLNSFDKFVKDKNKIDYVFILSSKQEEKDFISILDKKYLNAPYLKIATATDEVGASRGGYESKTNT